MQKEMNLNVRIRGHLQAFVASNTGKDGLYDNASEYVRDLIRRDLARAEQAAFEAKRLALQQAFAWPEDSYVSSSVAEIVGRNQPDT